MCSFKVFNSLLLITLLLNSNIYILCQNNNDDNVYDYSPSVTTSGPTEKANDDFVYDYSFGMENNTSENITSDVKPTASANTTTSNTTTVTDDYVYDYASGADNGTAVTKSGRAMDVKDDYVYDYVSASSATSSPSTTTESSSSSHVPETTSLSSASPKTTGVGDEYVYDYEGKSPNVDPKDNTTETKDDFVYDYPSSHSETSSEASADKEEDSKPESRDSDGDSDESKVGEVNIGELEDNSTESTPTTTFPYEDFGYDDEVEGECGQEGTLPKLIRLHEENLNITKDYTIKHVAHVNQTLERIQYVHDFYEKYFGLPNGFGTEMLAFISSIDIILTPECFASLFSLISGYRNNRKWANKFTDSMGRIMQTGSGDGKHSSFGEFDECLDLESPDEKGLIVKGQYCLVKVLLPYPKLSGFAKDEPYLESFDNPKMTTFTGERYFNGMNATTITKFVENMNLYLGASYRLGLCTPSHCKRSEIEEFLNKALYPITRLPISIDQPCQKKDKTEDLKIYEIISLAILTLLFVLVVSSTGVEVYNRMYEKAWHKSNAAMKKHLPDEEMEQPYTVSPYYYTFSLVVNGEELVDKKSQMCPLDTIRLFVMLHIYVYHLYNTMATIGIVTLKRTFATYPSLVLENDRYFSLRTTLTFDIIFVLSGFIAGNALLGKLEKNKGKFNYLSYLVTRYLRFAVPLLGSIIFFYTVRQIGSGPIWEEGSHWVLGGCENPLVVLFGFLFVSNYNDEFGIMERQQAIPYCNPSTWLVSALFQLHILVPILIIIYYKNPKLGLRCMAGAIVLGMGASIAPAIAGIIPYTQYLNMNSYEEMWQSFTWYHLSTTQYIVSFMVGVIAGVFSRRELYFPVEYEVGGWLVSGLALIISLSWNNVFWKPQKASPLYSVLMWYTFGKLGFAVAFSWLFFCLCTGRANTLEKLLSWHVFKPFARLSFSFFMVHFMVVVRRVFAVKETIAMSDGLMMEYSLLDLIYSFLLAYCFYSMVEAPFTYFMNLYLHRNSSAKEEPDRNGNVVNVDADEVNAVVNELMEQAEDQKNWDVTDKNKLKRDTGHFQDIELEEDVNEKLKMEENRTTNHTSVKIEDDVEVFRF